MGEKIRVLSKNMHPQFRYYIPIQVSKISYRLTLGSILKQITVYIEWVREKSNCLTIRGVIENYCHFLHFLDSQHFQLQFGSFWS